LLCCLLGAMLPAQVPLADTEEQRRRAQEEAEERQRLQQAPNVHLKAPEARTEDDKSLDLPIETPSFRIDQLVLELHPDLPVGLHRQSGCFRFARRYLDRYRGRQIGPEGIKRIMNRLTRRILARGYTTTRVDLPEQDLSGGTLKLILIPGVIRSIRFADPAPRGTWRTAFPVRPGDLLNIRDLEQGLEQMKRVSSQDVTIAIAPGTLPGESEVVLTVKRGKPWRASLSLDDSGTPTTGQWQGNFGTGWDNPLGWSDLFSAGLSHDVTTYKKGSGTRGASLGYSVPLGYWTFSSSWSQSDYAQRIAGTQRDIVATGNSMNLDFRVGYLFHRDQFRKDTIQLRTGHRASRSFIDNTEIDVQRRRNSFVELSLIHSQSLGRAQLDLTGAWRQGVSWFGAQGDLAPGNSAAPTFFYRLQTLDATLTMPVDIGRHRLQYTATVRGQHTRDQLYASEYLTIGSRWTVRGFDGEHTLASENGGFFRNDLDYRLGLGATAYVGVDAGRVYGANEANLPGRSLAGMVLGLKGVLVRRLSYNLFLGGPLHQPSCFRNPWPVLGFSASIQF
jgi:hemolysin activation/secretion protein